MDQFIRATVFILAVLQEWWACSTAVGWKDGCRAVGLQWRVGWEGVPSIRDLGGVLEVLCPKEWP